MIINALLNIANKGFLEPCILLRLFDFPIFAYMQGRKSFVKFDFCVFTPLSSGLEIMEKEKNIK